MHQEPGTFVLPNAWDAASARMFEVEGFERATIDRFFLAVGKDDPAYDEAELPSVLARAGALRISRIPEGRR